LEISPPTFSIWANKSTIIRLKFTPGTKHRFDFEEKLVKIAKFLKIRVYQFERAQFFISITGKHIHSPPRSLVRVEHGEPPFYPYPKLNIQAKGRHFGLVWRAWTTTLTSASSGGS